VVAALLKRLTDSDEDVRWAAARALGQLGVATPEVTAALLKDLTDPERYVRGAATEALGQLGAQAGTPEVMAALLKRLTDSERYVRGAAAGALSELSGYVRPQDRPAIVKLFLPLTRSRVAETQETVYVALRNLLAGDRSEAAQA